jgi:hypothetical protein
LISFNDRDFKSELYIDRIRNGQPKLLVPVDVDITRQGEVDSLIEELCAERLQRTPHGFFDWDRGSRPNHFGDRVKLATSLRRYGMIVPLVWNKQTGNLVNGRLSRVVS